MVEPSTEELPTPGERVRFCLACGAMVPFEVRTCPACGHVEPGPGGAQFEVSCPACGTPHAASLQTCPGCGQETPGLWPPVPRAEQVTPQRADGLVAALVLLAWLAPLLSLLALALALRS